MKQGMTKDDFVAGLFKEDTPESMRVVISSILDDYNKKVVEPLLYASFEMGFYNYPEINKNHSEDEWNDAIREAYDASCEEPI